MTCLAAHTPPGFLPPFVNLSLEADGSVRITLRARPTTRPGFHVCGFAGYRGAHGRCTPGDDRCNNYCNMAPDKGPMQPRPTPCDQITEGGTVSATFDRADVERVLRDALAALAAQPADSAA